jgi:hypothetical protein
MKDNSHFGKNFHAGVVQRRQLSILKRLQTVQYSIFCGSLFDHANYHMSAAAGRFSGQRLQVSTFGFR